MQQNDQNLLLNTSNISAILPRESQNAQSVNTPEEESKFTNEEQLIMKNLNKLPSSHHIQARFPNILNDITT
jgi:hypothetical protein